MNKFISPQAVELIKKHEGLDMCVYVCPAGQPTIGYGHVLTAEERAANLKQITEEKAEELLRQDINKAVSAAIKEIKVFQTENQIGALTSLIFNIGAGAFKKSTLLKAINEGASNERIKALWMQWVHGGGRVLPGLVTRRAAEVTLYFTDEKGCAICGDHHSDSVPISCQTGDGE